MRHINSTQFANGERYTDEELKQMPTPRLYALFRRYRAWANPIHWGHRCCEICHEYIGDDYYNDVIVPSRPYVQEKERVQAELNTRPDQFTHRNKQPTNRRPGTVRRRK